MSDGSMAGGLSSRAFFPVGGRVAVPKGLPAIDKKCLELADRGVKPSRTTQGMLEVELDKKTYAQRHFKFDQESHLIHIYLPSQCSAGHTSIDIDVRWLQVAVPKSARKGRPYALRFNLNPTGRPEYTPPASDMDEELSKVLGCKKKGKMILDCGNEKTLKMWLTAMIGKSFQLKPADKGGAGAFAGLNDAMSTMSGMMDAASMTKGEKVVEASLTGWKASGIQGDHDMLDNEKAGELEVGEELASGNFGKVYMGKYRGRDVAVKVLIVPEDDLSEARFVAEDFTQEVEMCCRIKHPCIVEFLGYTTAPRAMIIQELVPRGSLYDCMKKQQFRPDEAQQVQFSLDVALGMTYLHAWSPPLIHRDLKSLNLLVTAEYRLKITDFGMTRAKAVDDDLSTVLMTECGTPYWTAPEMFVREGERAQKYNEKVDQYAFAMTVIEIVTADTPWKGNPMVVERDVCAGKRPPMPADMDPDLRELTAECYDQDPAKRPAFREVATRLARICVQNDFALPPEIKSRA